MKITISFFAAAAAAGCAFAGLQLPNLAERPDGGRFNAPEDRTWPEKPGDADVCLWSGDRFAACCITIDDNFRPDHKWWLDLGEELGIRFTWFAITDGIVGDGDREGTFQGNWSEWQKLADAGHSIQSHTTNHRCDPRKNKRTAGTKLLSEEELSAMYRDSLAEINANITNNFACTIAYPNGDAHPDVAKKFAIACRGENETPNAPGAIDYMNVSRGVDGVEFADAVSGKSTPPPQWLAGNKGLKRGLNIVRHHFVHAGKSEAERTERAARVEKEVRRIAALKDGLLWVCRFDDVMKYCQERDTAKLAVTENGANSISFELSDDMNDGVFDFPLTVKVRLPDDWKSVRATQGGKPAAAEFTEHGGAPFALVQAVPDRGTVNIFK